MIWLYLPAACIAGAFTVTVAAGSILLHFGWITL